MKLIKLLSLFLILILFICGCQKQVNDKTDDKKDGKEEVIEPFGSLSNGSFILTSESLNGGATLTITSTETGEFTGSCYEINKKAKGVDYDGVYSSNSFTGRFTEPIKFDDYIYSFIIEEFSIDENVGKENIVDGKKIVNMLPYGIEKGAEATVFYPGAKISEMPEDFLRWAKNSYYFEGDTLPVCGLMISYDGENYGWILQEK